MSSRDLRFRLFNLDRLGQRSIFLVPMSKIDSFKTLPGVDLSHTEIRLLLDIAETVKGRFCQEEHLIRVKHPVKACINNQTARWSGTSFDEKELLSMLKETPALLLITAAAVDTQLRGIKRLDAVPAGIYNFVLPSGESDVERWFMSVLSASTFCNELGAFGASPIDIRLKDYADLAKWEKGLERMVLVRTASGSLLWPLLEQLEEQEQIRKASGIQSSSSTPPLILSKGFLQCQQATDILLPRQVGSLNTERSQLLRAAISRVINKETAKKLLAQWQTAMQSKYAFCLSGFRVWHVRLIIHAGLPLSLDGYVQEIGRAGRDGKKARCVMLYSSSDFAKNERIIRHGSGSKAANRARKRLNALKKLLHDDCCLWQGIERYFGEKPGESCKACSRCKAKGKFN